MTPTLDPELLSQWEGRSEKRLDVIDAGKARLMQATLDQKPSLQDGDALPALWHWLYFVDVAKTGELAADGLMSPGPIIPPVDLPNRMWAGTRFEFNAPLIVGQIVERERTLASVSVKQGRSGPLCFLKIRDVFRSDARLLFTEEHDLVYRTSPDASKFEKVQVPYQADLEETAEPGEILLFRYSALTFNAHRIHYDLDYCRDVEGYPGLVVQGPLTATLLYDFARRSTQKPISRFRLIAKAPVFAGSPVRLACRRLEGKTHVWAETSASGLVMDAEAE